MSKEELLVQKKAAKAERKLHRIPSMWEVSWKEIRRSPFALGSLIVLTAILLVSFIGAGMTDEGYATRIVLGQQNLSPSQFSPLGTDDGGRDMLDMLFLSARNSFAIAFLVTIFTLLIGYVVGLISGFYGGYVDLVIMRLIDFVIMVPTIMVIIVMAVTLPQWDIPQFVLVMVAFGWVGFARSLRARVLQESAKDYVQASKTLGTPNIVIMFREVFPNVVSFMMVGIVLGLASNMGLETGLTVIGYGLPFGVPSIGRLIALALNPIVLAHRVWQWLPAALVIFLMTLSIYGVGSAISRAVDPRQRRS